MEQAMARAEAATGTAQHSLMQASQQAGAQHVGLSESGSYSDYLARKQDAAKAWAAVAGPGNNPRSVRGALAQGAMGAGRMADADLADREQRLGERNSGNAASWGAYNRGIQERAAAAEAAKNDRTKADNESRSKFQDTLRSRMQGDWANIDRQLGTFGFGKNDNFTIYGDVNPFGDNSASRAPGDQQESWAGDPDSLRLAQMARSQGLGDEANRYQTRATYSWGKRVKGGY